MCGIFGVIKNQDCEFNPADLEAIMDKLALFSERRGMESTGIVVKNPATKSISVYRESRKAEKYLKTKGYKNFRSHHQDKAFQNERFAAFGHTRIATNGVAGSEDNQPVIKNGAVAVHNGIVCNVEELWKDFAHLDRSLEVDTELIVGLIMSFVESGKSLTRAVEELYDKIEGYTSIALLSDKLNRIVLSTNCGSLYYLRGKGILLFASERFMLEDLVEEMNLSPRLNRADVTMLEPNTYALVSELDLSFELYEMSAENKIAEPEEFIAEEDRYEIKDYSDDEQKKAKISYPDSEIEELLEYNIEEISQLKRCTKCLLPETHPFIEFDHEGVCNYCHELPVLLTRKPRGLEKLKEQILAANKGKNTDADCIVLLSGGRDSCYGLHIICKVLGLKAIAYSYDWGMLTDLGRRNQSRMCAALGVQHIPVSADIKFKRKNINLNVSAWLKKPHLGTIGLFMAGDKAFIHFANQLKEQYGLPLIDSSNAYEITSFKYGFAGVSPFKGKGVLSPLKRLKLFGFFARQTLSNPAYINQSMWDSVLAFRHYLYLKLEYFNTFAYTKWDENEINKTLREEYNWEFAPDTSTSWRIGDGTTALYNYIYYTVAGFTENDCLRSNQIRLGELDREKGLELINDENKPRLQSLQWYCDVVDLDVKEVIKTVNRMKKLYPVATK